MNEITNPHDAFFKYFLGKPLIAADFLSQHLPAAVLALIDLSTLQEQKESFIDESLRPHFSDLLYSVRTKRGRLLNLYFLFEHKSYPDSNVAFQLLRYIMRIWEEAQVKKAAILPIVGLVVYHGDKTWNVARNFGSIFKWEKDEQEIAQTLSPYLPEFSYHLVDLSALSDEEIKGEVWQRVFALLLKHIYDPALGERLYNILKLVVELADKPTGVAMLIAMLRYVTRAGVGASKDEIQQTVTKLFPKEGGTLMKTAAQEWFEEGEEIGIRKGEEIGIQKGTLQTQRQTIVQILHHRFSLSSENSERLTAQLELITSADALRQLTDLSLEAFALNEFVRRLKQLLLSSTEQN